MGIKLLIILSPFTILLCAVAQQVVSQTNETFPARIFAQEKTIRENDNLYITCSTFGLKKPTMVYVYLCKDGLGIKMLEQTQDQSDTTFIIHRAGRQHSGNYSCAYSKMKFKPSVVVATRAHNTIQILIIELSLVGPSTVSEGYDVKFRCTFNDTLQTFGECQLIQSYLRKNEKILQVQAFNIKRNESNFIIEGAVMRDSGHYSCVVLPSKCIKEHEETLYGNNRVLLEVKGSLFNHLFIYGGLITVILLLGLCWIKQAGCSNLCNTSGTSEQPNTNMMEEQQEQTEGEDLEAQDRETFNIEDEDGYQNASSIADSTYSDDYEDVYAAVDDLTAAPVSASLYAMSFKRKKTQHSPDITVS